MNLSYSNKGIELDMENNNKDNKTQASEHHDGKLELPHQAQKEDKERDNKAEISMDEKNPEFTKLESISVVLLKKFPSLNIDLTLSKDYVPFIHVWKPIKKENGVQGMPFLPCFHIIVTLNAQDYGNSSEISKEVVLFQLHSFHGKVLLEEIVSFDEISTSTNFDLMNKMAQDQFRMCKGVEEFDMKKFNYFIQSCDQPLLLKIRSTLLIENFMGAVVLRSRLCTFALFNPGQLWTEDDNFYQCEECYSYQNDDHEASSRQLNDTEINESQENPFHRVFDKALQTDMEALEVVEKVRKSYLNDGSKSYRNYLPNQSLNVNENRDIKIKNEPDMIVPKSEILDKTIKIQTNQELSESMFKNFVRVQNSSEIMKKCRRQHTKKHKPPINITTRICSRLKRHNKDFLDELLKYQVSDKIKLEEVDRRKSTSKVVKEKKKTKHKTFHKLCSICLKQYDNEFQYNQDQTRHLQAFDLNSNFTCPLCKSVIDNKYLVTSHFEKHHGDKNVTCCCECSLVIPRGSNRLRRHILKFHHTAGERLVCPDCGKEYSGIYRLEMHQAEEHGEKKEIICHHCGRSWAHEKNLKDHLRKYHQPHLVCPHKSCDKTFGNRTQAIRHLNVHSGMKPYKCARCEYVSYRETNVATHFEKSHGRKKTSEDMIVDVVERDRMLEHARVAVEKMIKERKLVLKKETPETLVSSKGTLEKI